MPKEEIARRAELLISELKPPSRLPSQSPLKLELLDGESVIGGGAAPSAALPTRLIALSHGDLSGDELTSRLRANTPPIIARVEDGRVLLDLRTVFPDQEAHILRALASL